MATNVNSNVADINKVKAEDMNEIKSVVNGNYNDFMDEIYYKNGDTFITTSAMDLQGIMAGNLKVAAFDLVLPKRLDNITTVSCTDFTGSIAGASGYATPSTTTNYASASGYSLTISIVAPNRIRFRIQANTAWGNITNNSVCLFLCNSMSISFS